MTTVIAKNVSVQDLLIEDLGIEIPHSSQIDLTELFEFTEITESDDLKNFVATSNIVINDGTSDLSNRDGYAHISLQSELEDSKEEGLGWPIDTDPPTAPDDGQGWYNSDTGMLFVWNATKGLWMSSFRKELVLCEVSNAAQNKWMYPWGTFSLPDTAIYFSHHVVITAVSVALWKTPEGAGGAHTVCWVIPTLNQTYQGIHWVLPEHPTSKFLTWSERNTTFLVPHGSRFGVYLYADTDVINPYITFDVAYIHYAYS